MTAKEKLDLLSKSYPEIDRKVKIAKTNYDRRRKVTKSMHTKMTKLVGKGKKVSNIADKFGVSSYTVNYNTDKAFRAAEKARKAQYTAKKAPTATSENYFKIVERGIYKESLILQNKKLTRWVED